MREVELITTKVKRMGVTEDRRHIQMHRLQPIYPTCHEGVVPIDCEVEYEEYRIQKVVINDEPRYVAMDKNADGIVGDIMEANNSLRRSLSAANRINDELESNVSYERSCRTNAWEMYQANISYLRKASFLVRLKYLLTGRMY